MPYIDHRKVNLRLEGLNELDALMKEMTKLSGRLEVIAQEIERLTLELGIDIGPVIDTDQVSSLSAQADQR